MFVKISLFSSLGRKHFLIALSILWPLEPYKIIWIPKQMVVIAQ
jgi:hypothetical protein